MKVYLTHSKNIDYKRLCALLKNAFSEIEFIFPYDNSKQPVDSSKYLKTRGCDLLLADITCPSTGQGIEIGWADSSDIPIIFFYKKGADVSRSIKFLSDIIIEYKTTEGLIQELKEYL